ncbi:carboxymuconolactone decarboxylase family protein [Sorangium sp. So ce321]|uniref:carboxymuconolactone decarboxylase family protein n=1 Tax=Sorangium sp. So ce321 TaxID=3133300 RepID=UPI003F6199C5
MKNPAVIIPEAMPAILEVLKATKKGGVPQATLELVHLRVSQINGCSYCVDGGVPRRRTPVLRDAAQAPCRLFPARARRSRNGRGSSRGDADSDAREPRLAAMRVARAGERP